MLLMQIVSEVYDRDEDTKPDTWGYAEATIEDADVLEVQCLNCKKIVYKKKKKQDGLKAIIRFLEENKITYVTLDDIINTVGEGIFIPSQCKSNDLFSKLAEVYGVSEEYVANNIGEFVKEM
jgi:hypothetical protein